MGKQIRLGNCGECDGFVMVDIADGSVEPLADACRHCGIELDGRSILDVPMLEADRDGVPPVTCEACGERWEDVEIALAIEEGGDCPACEATAFGSRSAGS